VAATSIFKLVVLAIGSAASDPATRADAAETMAILEALVDDYYGRQGIRLRSRSWAFG